MNRDSYLALRESAAIFDLPGRGHIQATGEDRARLLHAMSSNHIDAVRWSCSCWRLCSRHRLRPS